MRSPVQKAAFFWAAAALALASDLATKYAIFERWLGGDALRRSMEGASSAEMQYALAAQDGVAVVGGFFHLQPQINTGVVWGMLGSWPGVVLMVGALAAAAVIFYFYRWSGGTRMEAIGLGLILGGALGNIYDRALYRYVRDFLDLTIAGYRWPTFNVADSAICVGAVLLAMACLVAPRGDKTA